MRDERLMSIQELADYLQLNVTTIYAWAQQGVLPGFKLGRSWRFRPSEIEAWLESNRQPPANDGRTAESRTKTA